MVIEKRKQIKCNEKNPETFNESIIEELIVNLNSRDTLSLLNVISVQKQGNMGIAVVESYT